jgi:hypothetical protein
MRPDSGSDLILSAALLLASGVGTAVSWLVFRLRWPRSEHRRRQKSSEMSAVFRAVADRREPPEVRSRGRSRGGRRPGAIGAGRAGSGGQWPT